MLARLTSRQAADNRRTPAQTGVLLCSRALRSEAERHGVRLQVTEGGHAAATEADAQHKQDNGHNPCQLLVLFVAFQRLAALIAACADQVDDQVDDRSDAEAAQCDELEHAGANLAKVEAVDAQGSEEPGQQPGNEKAFL